MWQVGNGNYTLIWKDKLIPSLKNFEIPFPPFPSTDLKCLFDLTNLWRIRWKTDVLSNLFDHQVRHVILSIGISKDGKKTI